MLLWTLCGLTSLMQSSCVDLEIREKEKDVEAAASLSERDPGCWETGHLNRSLRVDLDFSFLCTEVLFTITA